MVNVGEKNYVGYKVTCTEKKHVSNATRDSIDQALDEINTEVINDKDILEL